MVGAGAIPENGIADGTEQTVIPAITGNGEAGESNAEYIIAACNSLPDLLDALEEAQVEIERITKRNSKITERRRVMYYKIIGADNRSCNGGAFTAAAALFGWDLKTGLLPACFREFYDQELFEALLEDTRR